MRKKRSPIRDHSAESALFFRQAVVAFFGIIILMIALIVNLYTIQVQGHSDYNTRSDENRIKVVPVAPNRGLIFDRNGKLLAENRPVYALEVTPEKVKDIPQTLHLLRSFFSLSDKDIVTFNRDLKRTRRFNSITLKNQLTEEEVAIFSANQHRFPGVGVKGYIKRFYPYGDNLTHVLGYVAKINDKDIENLKKEDLLSNYKATRDIGKLGIERYYENVLHGIAGYQEVEVNNRGRVIRTLKYVPPIPGKDLYLNLDIDLQIFIRSILKDRRGAVVVLDRKDASVLAMVSTPSYDPNLFVHGISNKKYKKLLTDHNRPLVNRATLGIYPPASTIKPFIAIAALTEKVITLKSTRNDPGYWRLPNSKTRPYRDWKAWGHGRVNIVQSIEESVDTFFYQIAYDLGIDRISSWMSRFGFGQYTGLDIHEESKANMPTREWKITRYRQPWYKGDTIPVGIGQGYWTATPLQIAKATVVLVNKGEVHPPHLLNHIDSNGVQAYSSFAPSESISNVKNEYWNSVLEGMRLVNHGKKGTARHSFFKSKYQTGGKSGTAQVFALGDIKNYVAEEIAEHLRDHALYTGFAPFENPEIIVSIVLENAGGGSRIAAPIAKEIFDYVLLKKENKQKEKTQ